VLLAGTNALTAGLALLTVALYLYVYTPLKPRSSLNTLVGAVCGALPPVLGWTAATGRLEAGAWLFGLLLFLWQVPHFLALAWLYREDYARGGFRMLPALDPGGQLTGALSTLYSLALLPLGAAFALAGLVGPGAAAGVALLSLALVAASLQLWRRLDRPSARRLFFASVVVLPLVLVLLLADATPRRDAPGQVARAGETALSHTRWR
jgi:heme o synthase